VKQNLYFKEFAHAFGRVPESSASLLSKSIQKLRDSVGHGLYRVFEQVLPAESIRGREGERNRRYNSATTLFGMVSQVFRGGSLRDAVRELQAVDKLLGHEVRSENTGSYAEARGRLDAATVEDAHRKVAEALDVMTPRNDRGGRILSVDATGVQLDDSTANLEEFDYAACQRQGCGFPVMQQVALMDLGSGRIVDAVATNHIEGESPLFEVGLSDLLKENDILVADRAYCSFLNFVRVVEAGADAVMRLNASRDKRPLKNCDDVVVEERPGDGGLWVAFAERVLEFFADGPAACAGLAGDGDRGRPLRHGIGRGGVGMEVGRDVAAAFGEVGVGHGDRLSLSSFKR